jgi:hypothetical protein
MDVIRLKTILTNLTGKEIGVKWMRISTDYGSKKNSTPINEEPTKALVLEGPQDQVYELRDILSTWYGSKSKSFPDGVRMRLIPPLEVLMDVNRQENYGAAIAKQASFVSKIGKGSTWEFTSNLILDKKEPIAGISMRQLLMAIPSSNHPNYPLFHCVNRGWKEGSTVVFHFLPCNESEARMYISGIIAYLRATASSWYLDLFKPLARARRQGTSWDPTTRQLTSVVDSNFTETLQMDQLYDLTDSSAGLISEYSPGADNQIIIDIPANNGTSLGFYKDTDSISTFRSTVRSVLKKKVRNSISTPTITTTPTQSVSFAPTPYALKQDDTSLSRLSDTASKVAGLETRFEQMEFQFSSSFARLEVMLTGLGTNSLVAGNTSCTGSTTTPVNKMANPPPPASAGNSHSRVAGTGS